MSAAICTTTAIAVEPAVAFRAGMGLWWADLLDAARRRAREHPKRGRTP